MRCLLVRYKVYVARYCLLPAFFAENVCVSVGLCVCLEGKKTCRYAKATSSMAAEIERVEGESEASYHWEKYENKYADV